MADRPAAVAQSADDQGHRRGGAGAILLAGALLSIGWLARWLLNRRKLADWEAAWTLAEPRWTKQR
jgi:hypothetical protein